MGSPTIIKRLQGENTAENLDNELTSPLPCKDGLDKEAHCPSLLSQVSFTHQTVPAQVRSLLASLTLLSYTLEAVIALLIDSFDFCL